MSIIGYVDDINRYSISGWIGDTDSPEDPIGFSVIVDGIVVSRQFTNIQKSGLDEMNLNKIGIYGFKIYFESPLSPFQTYEISVIPDSSKIPLEPGNLRLEPVKGSSDTARYRPHNAILLSTMGRSGSTLLMGVLNAHPHIIIGDKPPFEIELLTYYAYLFRALVAAGDHELSLRPDDITNTKHRMRIGFNPYFEQSFALNFNTRHLFTKIINEHVPLNLQKCFKSIILDYYMTVAEDKNKPKTIFFAEKAIPEIETRQFVNYIFPNKKEIILTRDLRDVLCSFMKYGNVSFKDTVDYIHSSSKGLLSAYNDDHENVYIIRYEDLVLDPQKTKSGLFQYLGLPNLADDLTNALSNLFTGHGTSESPKSSIGRWKHELTEDQTNECAEFIPFLEAFGYN
jgi:hypothetical protein